MRVGKGEVEGQHPTPLRVKAAACIEQSGEMYLAVLFYESLAVVGKGDDGAKWSGFINQFSIT